MFLPFQILKMYQFDKSKENILSILNSKTKIENKTSIPVSESQFTYENGITTWVGALFVDIVKSSRLFKYPNENTARIIRSFCSEIISILRDDENFREIGIRGDCVYCIYSVSYQNDLVKIFHQACRINSFIKLLNKLLIKKGFTSIQAGIGLGCSPSLIIKAGQSGTGINDRIWIGKSVVDASHISNMTNRNGIHSIGMSPVFYNNIIDNLCKKYPSYKGRIFSHVSFNGTIDFYHCNITEIDFDRWIGQYG